MRFWGQSQNIDDACDSADSRHIQLRKKPPARIVSAFLDKSCNPQDDGMFYSQKIHEILTQAYSLDPNVIERAFLWRSRGPD